MRPGPRVGVAAVCLVLLFLAPDLVNPGLLFVIGLTMIQAVFALSWNLLFRYAGLASFGHAMFYGIGAYCTAAIIFHHLPIPFLAAVLLSTILGGVAAFVVGVIVLPRTTGIQLAVLTLALSQLALLFVSYSTFLGRDDGLSGLTRPRLDFGAFIVDLTTPARYYTFVLVVCAAALPVATDASKRRVVVWPEWRSVSEGQGVNVRAFELLVALGVNVEDAFERQHHDDFKPRPIRLR